MGKIQQCVHLLNFATTNTGKILTNVPTFVKMDKDSVRNSSIQMAIMQLSVICSKTDDVKNSNMIDYGFCCFSLLIIYCLQCRSQINCQSRKSNLSDKIRINSIEQG